MVYRYDESLPWTKNGFDSRYPLRMLLFSVFSRMKGSIKWHVQHHASGLYLYIVFPIAVSFLLTFIGARTFNHFWPNLYIPWPVNEHIHHYAYGFFILAASGYLALVFSGPRAKYYISLLHGFGLGLAFDEYGFWLKLTEDSIARWEYDGFIIIIGLILLIISAKPGWHFIKHYLFPRHFKLPEWPNNGSK